MNSVRLLGTSTSLVKVVVVAVAGRCVKERVAEQAVRASKRFKGGDILMNQMRKPEKLVVRTGLPPCVLPLLLLSSFRSERFVGPYSLRTTMDKHDYLELLQLSKRSTRPEEGCSWIGSHDQRAPAPFGTQRNAYVRRYNRQWLKDRFQTPQGKRAVDRRRKARPATASFSPMREYDRYAAKSKARKGAKGLKNHDALTHTSAPAHSLGQRLRSQTDNSVQPPHYDIKPALDYITRRPPAFTMSKKLDSCLDVKAQESGTMFVPKQWGWSRPGTPLPGVSIANKLPTALELKVMAGGEGPGPNHYLSTEAFDYTTRVNYEYTCAGRLKSPRSIAKALDHPENPSSQHYIVPSTFRPQPGELDPTASSRERAMEMGTKERGSTYTHAGAYSIGLPNSFGSMSQAGESIGAGPGKDISEAFNAAVRGTWRTRRTRGTRSATDRGGQREQRGEGRAC